MGYRNAEFYPDPTAGLAFARIARAERRQALPIKIILYGAPRTKKNHQQIRKTPSGRRFVAPSKAYMEYEGTCLAQIKRPQQAISEAVNVTLLYYMPTRRRVDKTNLEESLLDILVRAGVLADDNRDIVAATDGSRVLYDKQNPRVEITITRMEGYQQWSSGKNKEA